MARVILSDTNIHEKITSKIGGGHQDVINQVIQSISTKDVVVIGMRQNPFCKSAKKKLNSKDIDYQYLEYGSYFSEWKPRLAIKIWSGWPTLPMIFVKGCLIGGSYELGKLLASDDFSKLLTK
ncbi:MAG: glutaredoxin-related protein [Bermanella sp.]|jgi:glutaredoxin-related protein